MNDTNNKKETNIFDNGVSEKEYHKKIKEQKIQSFNDTKEYLDNLKSIENKRFPYKNEEQIEKLEEQSYNKSSNKKE